MGTEEESAKWIVGVILDQVAGAGIDPNIESIKKSEVRILGDTISSC